MIQLEDQDITQEAIARLADCQAPRFKQITAALIAHLHAFVREVQPSQAEWFEAIQFLTATGQKCDDKRQEFILLSDTLGVSMLVVALNQIKGAQAYRERAGADAPMPTEATVQGPFYWEGSPPLPLGSDIGAGMPGEPTYYSGRVTDTQGHAIANCCLDVWSGDGDGLYDMQLGDSAGMRLRARFHTDAEGHYRFWSIRPSIYPVPDDGPVGAMLRKMGRHPNRPGHIHMMLYAPGYQSLTTHLFVSDSPYLHSDVVFGVRDSLIVDFVAHPSGTAPDGRAMSNPYYSATYNFKLVPAP